MSYRLRLLLVRHGGRQMSVKALVFDVFGTVVDWRSSLIEEFQVFGWKKGITVNWEAFVDDWKTCYRPGMDAVREGRWPWTNVDGIYRKKLDGLLRECGITGLSEAETEQAYALAEKEVERKEIALREGQAQSRVADRPVIIVDDGLATGATALAAAQIVRAQSAAHITLAVPVAPRDYDARIDDEVDHFVALALPRRFSSVGTWYRDFRQVEDEQVQALLRD